MKPSKPRAAAKKVAVKPAFSSEEFLAVMGAGRTIEVYAKRAKIFAQGDLADSVFYVQSGNVQLSVLSPAGKKAVIAVFNTGDFFGEGCLTAQQRRMATAVAFPSCSLVKVSKAAMIRTLHEEPIFSGRFIEHLLKRNIRVEEDLVDQLFNSSEKRLARILLLLANFGKPGKPEEIIADISQEALAEMIGTTRSRVSFFLNKFRKLGFIEYNGKMRVHSSLLNVILHD